MSTITRSRDAEKARRDARLAVRLIDPDTARTIESFMRRIGRTYQPVDAILYGSRARGTHRQDSDVDLAVILAGRPGDRVGIGVEMAGIAVDVFDETGILVSPLPLWSDEIERPDTFSNPSLIEAIRREGLRL